MDINKIYKYLPSLKLVSIGDITKYVKEIPDHVIKSVKNNPKKSFLIVCSGFVIGVYLANSIKLAYLFNKIYLSIPPPVNSFFSMLYNSFNYLITYSINYLKSAIKKINYNMSLTHATVLTTKKTCNLLEDVDSFKRDQRKRKDNIQETMIEKEAIEKITENAEEANNNNIICPLTLEIPKTPVTLLMTNGVKQYFDYNSLVEWRNNSYQLQYSEGVEYTFRHPITRELLTDGHLVVDEYARINVLRLINIEKENIIPKNYVLNDHRTTMDLFLEFLKQDINPTLINTTIGIIFGSFYSLEHAAVYGMFLSLLKNRLQISIVENEFVEEG